jgi:hypothetical protein
MYVFSKLWNYGVNCYKRVNIWKWQANQW